MTSVLWFRRDLRLSDHPALAAAGDRVLAVFVLDDRLIRPAGTPRLAFLYDCLRALDADLNGRLLVVHGDPTDVLPRIARSIAADAVHITADCGPYGRSRDAAVAAALDVDLVATGSPYAITPGRVRKRDGTPFRVFTPFHRAWLDHGWPRPAAGFTGTWLDPADRDGGPRAHRIPTIAADYRLPPAGEQAALRRWAEFRADGLADYDKERDRPDHGGTSRLSPYLRWGCVHPRTLLADHLPDEFRAELAWREFHADVLWHRPRTARQNYDRRFDAIEYGAGKSFDAWCRGETGYPIVDAGMRQLLAEGWMHNRVRMIVASFLVKDLHLPWWQGARHFMRHLVDGDLASNQLNWQWVAGSGTDAAPYFRIFNPVTQGRKFDPKGDYVRRYVPELRSVATEHVHEPWRRPDGPPAGYPSPIVDHAEEREVALARYGAIAQRGND